MEEQLTGAFEWSALSDGSGLVLAAASFRAATDASARGAKRGAFFVLPFLKKDCRIEDDVEDDFEGFRLLALEVEDASGFWRQLLQWLARYWTSMHIFAQCSQKRMRPFLITAA